MHLKSRTGALKEGWSSGASVQSLSHVQLCATPRTAAHQASASITNSCRLPKLISIELVMPSNHLILCRPLLPPSIFPSIRVFSNESVLHIRWAKYWGFSFNISPPNEHSGLISLQSKGLSRVSPTPQFKSISRETITIEAAENSQGEPIGSKEKQASRKALKILFLNFILK